MRARRRTPDGPSSGRATEHRFAFPTAAPGASPPPASTGRERAGAVAAIVATRLRSFGRWLITDPLLLLILALGVAARIWWVADARIEPVDDTLFYHQQAADVAAGRGFVNPETGRPTAFLPPGYSLLLGGAYWLVEPSQYVAGAVNVVISAGIIILTYALARRFANAWAARLAALGVALLPSLLLYTTASLPDLLSTMLVLAALALAFPRKGDGMSRARIIGLGLVMGGALLTAPRLGVVVPALALSWLALAPWREAAKRTVVVAAIAGLVVLPWTIRTWIQLDAFVPVATNDGANLWVGNNEDATGTWMSWRADGSWGYPEGDEVAQSRRLRNDALHYAFAHPLKTVELWPKKIDYTFDGSFGYIAHFSFVPRTRPLPKWMDRPENKDWVNEPFEALVRLGLLTMTLAIILRKDLWLLLPTTLALLLPGLIFFGLDRYQIPLLPIFVIFSAWGVTWATTILFHAIPSRALSRLAGRTP